MCFGCVWGGRIWLLSEFRHPVEKAAICSHTPNRRQQVQRGMREAAAWHQKCFSFLSGEAGVELCPPSRVSAAQPLWGLRARGQVRGQPWWELPHGDAVWGLPTDSPPYFSPAQEVRERDRVQVGPVSPRPGARPRLRERRPGPAGADLAVRVHRRPEGAAHRTRVEHRQVTELSQHITGRPRLVWWSPLGEDERRTVGNYTAHPGSCIRQC